jgi:hypothetical protein
MPDPCCDLRAAVHAYAVYGRRTSVRRDLAYRLSECDVQYLRLHAYAVYGRRTSVRRDLAYRLSECDVQYLRLHDCVHTCRDLFAAMHECPALSADDPSMHACVYLSTLLRRTYPCVRPRRTAVTTRGDSGDGLVQSGVHWFHV